MIESKNLEQIFTLINKLINDYKETRNKGIDDFLECLKDYLANPLSINENSYELIKKIDQLNLKKEDFELLWNKIKDFIEKKYFEEKGKKDQFYKEKLLTYEQQIINFLMDIGKTKGTNETLSAIIGYFLIHKHLTQAELKELSGFSRGAISENLKKLVKVGFAQKEKINNSKTYQYSIGENMAYVAKNVSFVKTSGVEQMKQFIQQKYEELQQIGDSSKKGFSILSERLNELLEFFRLYQDILQKIIKSPMIKNLIENKDEFF